MLLRKRKQLFNNQFILLTISKFTLMKKLFVCALALATFVACDKEPNGGLNSEDKVYMEFKIQTLTTRSATDGTGDTNSDANPDYEVGQDYENKISSVDVVLRNANTYVSATVTNPTSTDNTTWVAEFESSQLATGTDYEVYIYANCSAKRDLNATSNAAIGAMTEENKFWMTNAYAAKKVSFSAYSTDKANPTSLGEHYVERAMARFDFMPKGPYTLSDAEGNEVAVTLTQAALINQSKAFYLLRRVSADGTNTNWAVGGVETLDNYVVDVDYAAKANGYDADDVKNFDAHMTAPAGWVWKSIAEDDLKDKPDNWVGTGDGKHDETNAKDDHELNQYYFWQYAKENTIPGVDAQEHAQEHGISTGVVFKGELSGDKVPANGTEPIYVFDNVLYGTWAQVVAAVENSDSEAFKFAVEVCNDKGKAKDAATLAKAGFTGYSPVGGKYYVYYYYWNRHNDNGQNTDMGKMEFAVVRNNVYKLCVDDIQKFGHPTPGGTDPDPDPVDPKDPDEQGEYYFKVTVKVLPWVVRVNHIEF